MSKREAAIVSIIHDYIPMARPETLTEIARKILVALEEQAVKSSSGRPFRG